MVRPLRRTEIAIDVASKRAEMTNPGNRYFSQNPASFIGYPTRLDTDLVSLTYWIFSQYTCLPRDFTIFIAKVYDFFETKGVLPLSKLGISLFGTIIDGPL